MTMSMARTKTIYLYSTQQFGKVEYVEPSDTEDQRGTTSTTLVQTRHEQP